MRSRCFMKTMLICGGALAPSFVACAATEQALKFMAPFTTSEYCARHVRASSFAVPKDFVDGQWNGIIAASDGRTYFSFSSHSPSNSAQFYRFDPAKAKVEHLKDVAEWCGQADSIGKWNAQGKIHSQLFEADGALYGSTTPAHMTLDKPYAGGHFLRYDLKTGACTNLGLFPDSRGGLLTMLYEPVKKRLYGISQGNQTLCYYDLATGTVTNLGSCQENPMQTRTLIADAQGNVYGCDWDRRIWRYRADENRIELLPTRLPHDPAASQPTPPKPGEKASQAWMTTVWAAMEWDPKTKWWYGVSGNDEYLFRFRPPARRSDKARVEGLAPFGFRPSAEQPRFASHGLARRGRELFYCSYPIWRPMAHLMRYHIDTGVVTDLGPIVTDGGRRVSEIHSLVVGSDGKLHAAAMVWSLDNHRDPAKPWGNRGGCFFHARFLVIDPDRDFEPGSVLAAAPDLKPVSVEYVPGRTLDIYKPAVAPPAGELRPAIVLIHGGGWGSGTPELLAPHARWFAGKGLVAVNMSYRLTSTPGVRVTDCVADTQSAVAWVREHAAAWGIDPQRIAVAGDSAGGHLAACAGLIAAPAARANALILWNPVIDTASKDGWGMNGYTEDERRALSPAHHVVAGAPPTLVIHGELDACTPIRWSERFVQAMRDAGNRADFVRLPEISHAFVIPGYGRHAAIDRALAETEAFLKSLGYLPEPQTRTAGTK